MAEIMELAKQIEQDAIKQRAATPKLPTILTVRVESTNVSTMMTALKRMATALEQGRPAEGLVLTDEFSRMTVLERRNYLSELDGVKLEG